MKPPLCPAQEIKHGKYQSLGVPAEALACVAHDHAVVDFEPQCSFNRDPEEQAVSCGSGAGSITSVFDKSVASCQLELCATATQSQLASSERDNL